MENPNFLKRKYDLHNAPEVTAVVKRTEIRAGVKISQTPEARIQSYLDRFKEIFDRKYPQKRRHGVEAMKRVLFKKFVIQPEEIPESYWRSQEAILRERGQQADYDQFSEEQKQNWKKEIAEGLLDDQQASLEQWLDYFASSDSDYLPDYLKYWVFRSVTQLAEYDKEKKEFPKRSKGTIKQFPDINHEALSYVIDKVIDKHQEKGIEFEYDIQPDEREAFLKALKEENFAKLYAWANDLMNPVPEHLLPITQGEWRKYEQNSDHKLLTQSIRGKGTGWCTAGENTAKKQLTAGAFYCYYSNDDEGDPTIPRLAIRMEGDKIAEVRGVAYKQNVDPFMIDVLEQKLEEFPDKEEYLKKDHDMKQLTEIDSKVKKGIVLNKEDLIFLYEIDNSIEGFGYKKDPRIKELLDQRNTEQDMLIVFDYAPEQIAHNKEEINENTKAYLGEWSVDVFQTIRKYPNIEYLYKLFPDKKIFMMTLETDPNINSPEKAEEAIKQKNIYLYDYGILNKTEFSQTKETYDLVKFSVKQLGFPNGATTDEIYRRAEELGLELCPAEVGPQLRLQYTGKEWMWIAMKQIAARDGSPRVFRFYSSDAGLELYGYSAHPSRRWHDDREFVFRFRKFDS